MVRIVTDSSSLYTVDEGEKAGIVSIPLCISIGEKHFRDLTIPAEEFIEDIKAGGIPTSSQPPIGEVLDVYERFAEDDIVHISLADGLSGAYQTACAAKSMAEHGERITVLNTETLCGPHRYLVECARDMAEAGRSAEEIIAMVKEKMKHTKSYLIPQDFAFLKRGGRLSPTVAMVGSLLNLKPIMTLARGGRSLDKFGVGRTMNGALKNIFKQMKKDLVGAQDILYIVHGGVQKEAERIRDMVSAEFPGIDIRIHLLSHAFITHGGPGCIALQHVRK
ncbi:MAG: DegV family protein [Lachnospiraceae bacterium]|nr:DegV family protein [Lachnospiraceae bacterium]